MMEVNTFIATGCKVIGRKFSGFPVSPFLYANTPTPDFYASGNAFVFQAVRRISLRRERRTGHYLKTKATMVTITLKILI